MYQKLFESWRGFKNSLNEMEVEQSSSEAYGKSFKDFLENLPTNEEIAEFESEMTSEVSDKKQEIGPEAAQQPIDSVSSPQAAKRYANKVWIFFDTETTALETGPYDQITQIAALAMDPKGFAEGVEPQEVGRFNKKLNLALRSKEKIAFEKEDAPERERRNIEKIRRRRAGYRQIAPGITIGKPVTPYELERPVSANLKLTDYGISPDERKRHRKAYATYAEKEIAAGRTPMSMEDFPVPAGPEEMIEHGPSVLKDFLEFIDQYPNRILVAQNAGFDVKQVDYMLGRVNLPIPQDKVFDTIKFFRKYLVPIMKMLNDKKNSGENLSEADVAFLKALTKNGKQTVSLGFLVKAFKLENKGWHDAFADVQMLHDAMRACIIFLQSRPEFMATLSQPTKPSRAPRRKPAPGEKPSDISLQSDLF